MIKLLVIYLSFSGASAVTPKTVKRSWGISTWGGGWCDLPPYPENGSFEVTDAVDIAPGQQWPTSFRFDCWPGHTLFGSQFIRCFDGRWSDYVPRCLPNAAVNPGQLEPPKKTSVWTGGCILPPYPENGSYEMTSVVNPEPNSKTQLAAKLAFTCGPGYTLVGAPTTLCCDGRWSHDTPQCHQDSSVVYTTEQPKLTTSFPEAVCKLPPYPKDGNYELTGDMRTSPDGMLTSAEIQFSCNSGSQLQGSPTITCVEGMWLQPIPECVPSPPAATLTLEQPNTNRGQTEDSCVLPQYPDNGTYTMTGEMTTVVPGQILESIELTFTCKPNYTLEGAGVVTCVKGMWSADIPQCRTSPPAATLTLEQSNTNHGQTEDSCVLPQYPDNGTYTMTGEMTTVVPGQILESIELTFTCKPNYTLEGAGVVTCVKGMWSADIPQCRYQQQKAMVVPDANPNRYGPWHQWLGHLPKDQMKVEDMKDGNASMSDIDSCTRMCMLQTSAASSDQAGSRKSFIAECGLPKKPRRRYGGSGVAGGRPSLSYGFTPGRELPWHVGIYDKQDTPYMQICGGSIISKSLVISAAHCFWDDLERQLPATKYAVGAGKLNRSWDNNRDGFAQKSDVKEIMIPPRYQHSTANFQEDIALVSVMKDFKFNSYVMPVCLNFDSQFDSMQLQEEKIGKVGGWGLTAENGTPSPELQIAELPYVDIKKCISGNGPDFQGYITSDKICAGYKNGTALCRGDSGGGLVYPEDDADGLQRYYLRGVVSASPRNENDCNIYAWATFTHILRHEHFITPLLTS